jgi:hypothetical protein
MDMIGHFGAGPLWECVKVDDYSNPSCRYTNSH